MLPEQLQLRRVLVIHIDETQHMFRHTKTDKERKDLAKAFKGVMNNPEWPVSFLMSAMTYFYDRPAVEQAINDQGKFLHCD